MTNIQDIIRGWKTGELKPIKHQLIDWNAYNKDAKPLDCMSAQGQILHLLAGWTPEKLDFRQNADRKVASLLNISLAHAILLRNFNNTHDSSPHIVLTEPSKVLGNQWSKILDLWRLFDRYSFRDWINLENAWYAVDNKTRQAKEKEIYSTAPAAIPRLGWQIIEDAASLAARYSATRVFADVSEEVAAYSAEAVTIEIACYDVHAELFFLPMFGINTLDNIPPRPSNYGKGIVPNGK
jgi:hypothetical protein